MKSRYLFVDDEIGEATTALLHGFNDVDIIEVESLSIKKKETFDSINEKIKKELKENRYDGILLDLCLDGTGANSLNFKAPILAQQIRSLSSESVIPHIPVSLCSTIDKVDIYKKDSASHDLFDYYFNKTEINYQKECLRLHSLAEGYQTLNKNDISVEVILGRKDLDTLDDKVVDYMAGRTKSSYDISRCIIKDMFFYSSVLIKEDVVAARMGVDQNESKEEWKNLMETISAETCYQGVFASGWKRYWADKVNTFFIQLSNGEPYQVLTASERVDILINAGFKGLVAAKPIQYNNSTYYNTICECCKRPIDSMEGIPIEDAMRLKPWQENHYVSFYMIAKGDYKEERLVEAGRKKFNGIKERFENEQQDKNK